jgi:hypothetical protein
MKLTPELYVPAVVASATILMGIRCPIAQIRTRGRVS